MNLHIQRPAADRRVPLAPAPARPPIQKGHIETIADGQLYALQNVIELDGRVSSYPADAKGYTVSNCYLIKQDRHALMLDSGLSAHEASIMTPRLPPCSSRRAT